MVGAPREATLGTLIPRPDPDRSVGCGPIEKNGDVIWYGEPQGGLMVRKHRYPRQMGRSVQSNVLKVSALAHRHLRGREQGSLGPHRHSVLQVADPLRHDRLDVRPPRERMW